MMNKLILFLSVFLFASSGLFAQKKELSQVRSILKSGRGLDNGQKILETLLENPENRQEKKIWLTLYQTLKKRYEEGNEKLYLKQQYDTASIFHLTSKMASVLFSLDSLDAKPIQGGKIKAEYRKKHADELNALRPNLFFGGSFFIRKGDYQRAYDLYNQYMDCAYQPLFTGYDFQHKDAEKMRLAAYWATYCGFKMQNPDLILRHADMALTNDSDYLCSTIQYMANAYLWKKDEIHYLSTLKIGFEQFPKSLFFFPRLVDYYTGKNQLDSALQISNKALQNDSTHILYLYAKSTLLLNMGDNDGSYAVSERIIALNDTLAEPYFNAGTSFLNKLTQIESTPEGRADKQSLKRLYEAARPYFERYRQLAPDQSAKWVPALYRIYLNLNMGKQFEEMDALMKEHS